MNFSMLLVNNNRSKAYLQNLVRNKFIPNKVIVLEDKNITLVEHTENDKLFSHYTDQKFIKKIDNLGVYFDEKEHILKTIDKLNIKHTVVNSIDVNSDKVISEIENITDKYIIFSGPSSSILKKKILSKNKNFIHVHPGIKVFCCGRPYRQGRRAQPWRKSRSQPFFAVRCKTSGSQKRVGASLGK